METCRIFSPGSGWVGSLSEAPDPIFSEKIMGDGILLDPTVGRFISPCVGVVANVATTQHSITLRTSNNAEILIHIGIDTVSLRGVGFEVHVKEGDVVETGAPLISFDLNKLAIQAKSLVTPIILANSDQFEIVSRAGEGQIKSGDPLMEIRAIEDVGANDGKNQKRNSSVTQTVRLPLAHGIHARPAARLSSIVKSFKSNIEISANGKNANAASPVSIMALGTKHSDELSITGIGVDAVEAVNSLADAIANGLGEAVVAFGNAVPKIIELEGYTPIEPVKLDGSESLQGTTGAPGLVIGEVVLFRQKKFDISEVGGGTIKEKRELDNSLKTVRKSIVNETKKRSGQQKEILTAHLALLEDPILVDSAYALIESGKSAGYAWRRVSRDQAATLTALDDPRMASRADDLADIESQILSVLTGRDVADVQKIKKGSIVVAEELLPSQFVRLIAADIAGVCVATGGPTSHVSILAADAGIPALVAMGPRVQSIPDGTKIILAAERGYAHVAPKKEDVTAIKRAISKRSKNLSSAKKHARNECLTLDGKKIEVFANLGQSGEVEKAIDNGAEGCGLLRSEFLFLGRTTPPSEDEQLKEYQEIADKLDGRPLVVRTLDVGGDKQVPFISFQDEENPALGMRGIRLSLSLPEILKTQFRALVRTRSKGPIHIMLPMIISLDELKRARLILDAASEELGITDKASLGIMIETPASVILADSLALEADFFSIGTNDLTQYVLAMDRGNAELASQIDGLHPAVLRMIKMTADAGHSKGKWVGVCGALASDLVAVPILIGLGIEELSTTASRLSDVKAFIRTLDLTDCQHAAEKVLQLNSPTEVRDFVLAKWPSLEEWI